MPIRRLTVRVVAILTVAATVVVYGTWSQARWGPPGPSTLRVGFGLVRGVVPDMGLEGLMSVLRSETLIGFGNDGRPEPRVADHWETSADRLTWTIHLRPGVIFHDGNPLTADLVADLFRDQLPERMGPAFHDIIDIRATSADSIDIRLRRPSAMLIEWLDVDVYHPIHGGTSAYRRTGQLELSAHDRYWGGRPAIDRVVVESYPSSRAAWADLLRGHLDMLYAVEPDAVASLAPSTQIKLFNVRRRYAYELQFNPILPALRDPEVRRRLNAAIDREALIAEVLGGHGRPEDSPLWPPHWANTGTLARVPFAPKPLDRPLTLTCTFPDAGLERLALAVQRQLVAIGVTLKLEVLPLDEFRRRWLAGDFELTIGDFVRGPTMRRPATFWYTGGAANFSHYSSRAVDGALDAIRDSTDEDGYRRGVAALGRALVDDPPSIFLVWAERTTAVTTRFQVHEEPGRDIMNTIHGWHLAPAPTLTH